MSNFVVGVDLGQAQDPSAVAVLERRQAGRRWSYQCRHLERYPLGTPYVTGRDQPPEVRGVGERLRALLAVPDLVGCTLGVDETGVGRAVIDSLRLLGLRCWLRPVTVTAGMQAVRDPDGSCRVPKRELVGTVQTLLGEGRLAVAASLPLTPTLLREMANYRVKITAAGNETFSGDWRTGQHDDLVFAVALACWLAERFPPFVEGSIVGGGRVTTPPGVFGGVGRAGGADARRMPARW